MQPFEVQFPLPPRRAAEALRDQLIAHLMRARPAMGEKFMSDHELARLSKLSRPTVRRALDELHRDGWIERRHGRGTFVGPRAAMEIASRKTTVGGQTRRVIRMAVLIHSLREFEKDWYSRAVIAGIDQAAEANGINIEMLGDQDGDVKSVSRRLTLTRPDVLAVSASRPSHALMMGEAQRLDIPCIGTGSFLASMGLPAVHEDGRAGAVQAVRHLAEKGHRRIGFIQATFAMPWVFHRRRGFLDGMTDAGLEADPGLVWWVDDGEVDLPEIEKFVARYRLTGLVCGCEAAARHVGPLDREKRRRIPQDLSVITFDQHPQGAEIFGGVRPTTIALPLFAMGRRLAELAREIVDRREITPLTQIPCELIPGDTVQPMNE
jgi:DNA-binding LacI/PurR family transcriptional regulator